MQTPSPAQASAQQYAAMSVDERRLWRLHRIPLMSYEEIIDFYVQCILPLETTQEEKAAILCELRGDQQFYLNYEADLSRQVQMLTDQFYQLDQEKIQAANVPQSAADVLSTSADDME